MHLLISLEVESLKPISEAIVETCWFLMNLFSDISNHSVDFQLKWTKGLKTRRKIIIYFGITKRYLASESLSLAQLSPWLVFSLYQTFEDFMKVLYLLFLRTKYIQILDNTLQSLVFTLFYNYFTTFHFQNLNEA